MEKHCGNCAFYIPNDEDETYEEIEGYCTEDRGWYPVPAQGDSDPCEKYCR